MGSPPSSTSASTSLLLALGLQLSVAKSISFVAGTTTAYLINRRWTFRSSGGTRAFVSVVLLYATTFAVQVGLNAVLVRALPEAWWRITLAFVIAQGTATVINFRRAAVADLPDPGPGARALTGPSGRLRLPDA